MKKKYVQLSLHYSLLTFFIFNLVFACAQKDQPGTAAVTAKDLFGSWTTIQGSAESITFAEENGKKMVYTYLNSRIFETGEWQLAEGLLKITFDSGEESEYKINIRNGKDLFLRKSSGTIEQYEKIFTLTEKLTNWGIELGKQLNLTFSKTGSSEFNWQIQAEESDEGKTFPIQGCQIVAQVPAQSHVQTYMSKIKAIETYFESLGFANDPHNATETDTEAITGKIRYEEIIQIIASKDPGSTANTPLKINLGALPESSDKPE